MRIALVEDAAILRNGLAELLLKKQHEVVIKAANPVEFTTLLGGLKPENSRLDVVIMDIRMPPTFTNEGVECALRLRNTHPGIGILLFSQHVETSFVKELLALGAHGIGYLLKDRVSEVSQFMTALEQIKAGQTVLDPEVVTQLMSNKEQSQLKQLSAREAEVLALMAQGKTNASIAKELVLSNGAVEKHVTAIFSKLALPQSGADHRRVLAVLKFLETTNH